MKVKGGIGHAVALDEAHEMCINRDLKMAVVRPTIQNLQKTASFYSYRIKAQKQFTLELFPVNTPPDKKALVDFSSTTKQWNENVLQH